MQAELARTLFVMAVMAIAPAASAQSTPLRVVPELDLARYAGTWYEVARFPNSFQKKCLSDVTAEYKVRPDGRVDVTNRCRESGNEITEASGIARPVKGQPTSVLEVRFAPAFLSFLPMVWGDYQVIELDPDYQYAVVGTPDRKYLWVLSRTPKLETALYDRLMERARAQGFDVSKLVMTRHTEF